MKFARTKREKLLARYMNEMTSICFSQAKIKFEEKENNVRSPKSWKFWNQNISNSWFAYMRNQDQVGVFLGPLLEKGKHNKSLD